MPAGVDPIEQLHALLPRAPAVGLYLQPVENLGVEGSMLDAGGVAEALHHVLREVADRQARHIVTLRLTESSANAAISAWPICGAEKGVSAARASVTLIHHYYLDEVHNEPLHVVQASAQRYKGLDLLVKLG